MAKKKKFSRRSSKSKDVDPEDLNSVPSASSDVRIWPADVETALLEEKDPDFCRPPARSTNGSTNAVDIPRIESTETEDEDDSSYKTPPRYPSPSTFSVDETPEIEKETYVLSTNGNVLIKLKHQGSEVQYLVAEQILRLVSPVWDKCLDKSGPFFIETGIVNGVDTTILRLEDDDPDCLLNVLRLLHFQHDEVPDKMGFEDLRSIAAICDKYDCTKALQPWLKRYLDIWEEFALLPGFEDWLFIAKVLDGPQQRHIIPLINSLVYEASSLTECGTYVIREGQIVDVTGFPETFLCEITEVRSAIVENSISMLRKTVRKFGDSSSMASYCHYEACSSLAYGSFLRSIKGTGLWPLLSHKQTWHGSVEKLRERLKAITYVTVGDEEVANAFRDLNNDDQSATVKATHSCELSASRSQILGDFRI